MKRLSIALVFLLAAPLFGQATTKAPVLDDTMRLASLLSDMQHNVTINEDVWKTVVNEANSLANCVYGRTSGNGTARAAARELRTHVREMRKAALAGDAEGAREHAKQAMPSVSKIIDWSS